MVSNDERVSTDEIKLIKWKINDAIIVDDVSNEAVKLYGSNTQIDYIVEILENLVFTSMAIDDDGKVVEHLKNFDMIKKFKIKTLNYMKSFRRDISKLYKLRYIQLDSKDIKEIIVKSNIIEELKSDENNSVEKILEKYINTGGELKIIAEIFELANDMADVYSKDCNKLDKNFLIGEGDKSFDNLYDNLRKSVIDKIASVSQKINDKVSEKIEKIKSEVK